MDLRTLRMMAGISQARCAELAGVSERTWRRWEQSGCTLAERWLRYEAGYMPGWPPGFRLGRGGIYAPSGDWMPAAVIEGARWALQLLDARDRERISRSIDAGPQGSPALHRIQP